MIICPICNQEVIDSTDGKPVENDHANNFMCPTKVDFPLSSYIQQLNHFTRRQLKYLVGGATAYTYQATVPPYQIVWITGHKVTVYELDSDGRRVQAVGEQKKIYQSKNNTDYNTFIKTCQRFKVLVPFS